MKMHTQEAMSMAEQIIGLSWSMWNPMTNDRYTQIGPERFYAWDLKIVDA